MIFQHVLNLNLTKYSQTSENSSVDKISCRIQFRDLYFIFTALRTCNQTNVCRQKQSSLFINSRVLKYCYKKYKSLDVGDPKIISCLFLWGVNLHNKGFPHKQSTKNDITPTLAVIIKTTQRRDIISAETHSFSKLSDHITDLLLSAGKQNVTYKCFNMYPFFSS